MIARRCTREREVQQAAATGRWTAELRGHTALCAPCDEVARVTHALSAPVPGAPASLDPAILLAQARQIRRLRAEARLSRMLTGAQIGVCALALCGMAAVASRASFWATSSPAPDGLWWLYAGAGAVALTVVVLSTSFWHDEILDRSTD